MAGRLSRGTAAPPRGLRGQGHRPGSGKSGHTTRNGETDDHVARRTARPRRLPRTTDVRGGTQPHRGDAARAAPRACALRALGQPGQLPVPVGLARPRRGAGQTRPPGPRRLLLRAHRPLRGGAGAARIPLHGAGRTGATGCGEDPSGDARHAAGRRRRTPPAGRRRLRRRPARPHRAGGRQRGDDRGAAVPAAPYERSRRARTAGRCTSPTAGAAGWCGTPSPRPRSTRWTTRSATTSSPPARTPPSTGASSSSASAPTAPTSSTPSPGRRPRRPPPRRAASRTRSARWIRTSCPHCWPGTFGVELSPPAEARSLVDRVQQEG